MAKLALNPSRQYALTAVQPINFDELDGTNAVDVVKLPRDAVILSGSINVLEAFDANGKIAIGTEGAATANGNIDVAATGVKALTVSGAPSDKTKLIATPNATFTKGKALLIVTYVLPGRGNEAQP